MFFIKEHSASWGLKHICLQKLTHRDYLLIVLNRLTLLWPKWTGWPCIRDSYTRRKAKRGYLPVLKFKETDCLRINAASKCPAFLRGWNTISVNGTSFDYQILCACLLSFYLILGPILIYTGPSYIFCFVCLITEILKALCTPIP